MTYVRSPATLAHALVVASALLIGCGSEPTSSSRSQAPLVDPPLQGGGTFAIQLTATAVSSADGNTFIDFDFHEVLTGAFDGTRDGSGRLVMHPDGTFNAHDCGSYVGTVGGIPGTCRVCVEAVGAGASIQGTFEAGSGTGLLTGIQGQGAFSGSATGPLAFGGTYSGQVHFQ